MDKKLKVGDIVVVKWDESKTLPEGLVTEITFTDNHKTMTPELDKRYPIKQGWANENWFRHATPEEILVYKGEVPVNNNYPIY